MALQILYYDSLSYGDALELQHTLHTRRVKREIPDTLMLLEHHPVITCGRNTENDEILFSPSFYQNKDIELLQVSRGGKATYHGPGQLVGYLIFSLEEAQMSPACFVSKIEDLLVSFVQSHFGIEGKKREGHPGVWVGETKIGSLGFRISRGVSFHGFALNISMDLTPFSYIRPCGLSGTPIGMCLDYVKKTIETAAVKEALGAYFEEHFTL
jgi:lipoate-protein ligase B